MVGRTPLPRMAYALSIGFRYLRGSTRGSVTAVTAIAVTGVALGVAALLVVLSITTGFQREFRDKVLGVNAHVLVMKYGVDFDEYPEVIARARAMPEVAGAGPFLIHEMMLVKEDRISTVLVKGVDPEGMVEVLGVPDQLVAGSIEGLRLEGAEPPASIGFEHGPQSNDWDWLEDLGREGRHELAERVDGGPAGASADAGVPDATVAMRSADDGSHALDGIDPERMRQYIVHGGGALFGEDGRPVAAIRSGAAPRAPREVVETAPVRAPTPSASVGQLLSPDEVEAMSDDGESGLPDDDCLVLGTCNETPAVAAGPLPGMLVGITLARTMNLHVGDHVRLVSPLTGLGVSSANISRTPVSRDYRITGIFEAGFQEYDTRLCYVDLYEAQYFYGQGDSVTGVELRLHDLDQAGAIAERLERELGGPFHTLDWMELNRNLFTALEIQKLVLTIVFSGITVVASFMVVVTLIMTVLEKKREIAILKAMGASDFDILTIFMVQGVVVGLVGTVFGLMLGGGIVGYLATHPIQLDPKVYLIDHLPVVIRPVEFVITVVTSMLICSVATLLPSLSAARTIPVDGLRYE